MKKQYILKESLLSLRKKAGLSLAELAEKAYTTNTTVFRIEKSGVVSDISLAHSISEALSIPFNDLFIESHKSSEALYEYEKRIKAVYNEKAIESQSYYLVFLIRYDEGKSYRAVSPTRWVSMVNGSAEMREIEQYYPNGLAERLKTMGIKCVVIHDEMSLIYFYYGMDDRKLYAMLIDVNIASALFPHLKTIYQVNCDDLIDIGGFNDCVPIITKDNFVKQVRQGKESNYENGQE